MPKYMFTGSYTAEGARGVLKEGGSARRTATEQMVGSVGGNVEAYYFAFGSDDFYLIADLPDNAAAAAGALTAGASGALGTRTIVLLTPDDRTCAQPPRERFAATGREPALRAAIRQVDAGGISPAPWGDAPVRPGLAV